jgi:hypothetical protein
MGVAVLASIVQTRSQQYTSSLAAQGITGDLLRQQSSLLAMHEGFLVASFLALVALVAMCFVPKRRRVMKEQPEQAPHTQWPSQPQLGKKAGHCETLVGKGANIEH